MLVEGRARSYVSNALFRLAIVSPARQRLLASQPRSSLRRDRIYRVEQGDRSRGARLEEISERPTRRYLHSNDSDVRLFTERIHENASRMNLRDAFLIVR